MKELIELIVIKKPNECSDAELQDFAALVRAGGEVIEDGLDTRINNAEALVFLTQNNCLKGIAAIKNPDQHYKIRVFQSAKTSVQVNNFSLELGWVYVMPSSRGKGLSHKLAQASLDFTGGQAIFSTARSDNKPMHKVLITHGFSKHGMEYDSSRDSKQKLTLFVRSITP